MESGVGYVDDHTYLGSYDGHSYFMSKQSFSWQDAKSEAEVEGGYLAMIKSEEENNAIQKFVNEILFIGLYQQYQVQLFFRNELYELNRLQRPPPI